MIRRCKARSRRGSTAVEYALLLALLCGVVILASDAVSYAMKGSLLRASVVLGDSHIAERAPSDGLRPGSDLVVKFWEADEAEQFHLYRILAVSVAIVSGSAALGLSIYRRRARQAEMDAIQAEEQSLPTPVQQDAIFAKRQQILRILSTDMHAMLDSRLEVRHLMSQRLVFATLKTPVAELRSMMESNKVRHLLVCNNRGLLEGIITDRDLIARTGRTAKELMTTKIETLEPHALVYPAITLMINKKISCLPVVEDGIPCGVLTATDLMMTLQCTMQVLQKVVKEITPSGANATPCRTISGQSLQA